MTRGRPFDSSERARLPPRGEEAVDEHVERVIVCQGLPPLDPDVPRHVSLLRPCDKRVYPVAEKLISTINVPVPLSAFE